MQPKPLYWTIIAHFARRELARDLDRARVKDVLRRAKTKYLDLVRSVDGVGDSNPMASNIHWSCTLFALWDASGRTLGADELHGIVEAMTTSAPMRLVGGLFNFNKPAVRRGFARSIEEKARWAREHQDECPNAWTLEPAPGERPGDVFFRVTHCPLAKMAEERGYGPIMTAVCGSDHLTAALFHSRLLREHTIAEGAADCDFLFRADSARS